LTESHEKRTTIALGDLLRLISGEVRTRHSAQDPTTTAYKPMKKEVVRSVVYFAAVYHLLHPLPANRAGIKKHVIGNEEPTSFANTVVNTQKSKLVVFFNTFSSANYTDLAIAIVKEQLQLLATQPLLENSTIFYYRIGNYQDWLWPNETCRKGNCVQIGAQKEGHEMLIHQKLHQYCESNPQDRVLYAHTKGSFNPSVPNTQWRQVLTRAVASTECLQFNKDQCNVCGTFFSPLPFNHFPGNMWVADCSYVSQLIPADKFESEKRRINQIVKNRTNILDRKWSVIQLNNSTKLKFPSKLLHWLDRESWIGVDRYAAEHWITSHPDLKPCQVFSTMDGFPAMVYGRKVPVKLFHHPRLRTPDNLTEDYMSEVKNWGYNPYYTSLGKIWEYDMLYGKLPPDDGWFYKLWNYFDASPWQV
jgi:hypothetical protein